MGERPMDVRPTNGSYLAPSALDASHTGVAPMTPPHFVDVSATGQHPTTERPTTEHPTTLHPLSAPPMDGHPLGDPVREERHLGERPLGESRLGERSTSERSMSERSMSERPTVERFMGERSVDPARLGGPAPDALGPAEARPAHASAPGRDRLDHTIRHDGSAPAG
jgi:hypothetical protein